MGKSLSVRDWHFGAVRWILFAILVLATGGAAVGADKFGSLWIAPAAAAGLLVLLPPLIDRVDQARERRARVREHLVRWPLTPGTANPYDDLRVSWSRKVDAYAQDGRLAQYVQRDADDDIREALEAEPFVLVIGPSKAGKSRSAYEAAAGLYGDRPLLVPKRPSEAPDALRELARSPKALGDLGRGVALLWLDDAQDFIHTRGLDVPLLSSLKDKWPSLKILATIRQKEFEALREQERLAAGSGGSSSSLGKETFEVLDRARHVWLDAELAEDELARAEEAYPDEDFDAGIGAQLIDAPKLIERLTAARLNQPQGAAIVNAVMDFERSGMQRLASREELFALARLPAYVEGARRGTLFTDEHLDEGLAWALNEMESGIALVSHADPLGETFEAFDYLLAYADGEVERGEGRRPLPSDAWSCVLEFADGYDAFGVGLTAWQQGHLSAGVDGMTKAEALVEDADDKAFVTIMLGAAQRDHGDLSTALQTLDRALSTAEELSDGTSVAAALSHRGSVLSLLGDPEAGRADLERAVSVAGAESDPEQLSVALRLLVHTLIRLGRANEAVDVAERARSTIEGSQSDSEALDAADARVTLGLALRAARRPDEALEAFERGVQLGEELLGPDTMFVAAGLTGRGCTRADLGDDAGAREDLMRALEIRQRVFGPRHVATAETLGALVPVLEKLGEADTARARLDDAIDADSEAPDGTTRPAVADLLMHRGSLAARQGNQAGALDDLKRALELSRELYGEDSVVVANGLRVLGTAKCDWNDLEGARTDYERAREIRLAHAPDDVVTGYLLHDLGWTKCRLGDFAGASEDLELALAIKSSRLGDADASIAYTYRALGIVQESLDDLSAAEASFAAARDVLERTACPDQRTLGSTLADLGRVEAKRGEPAAAAEDLKRALPLMRTDCGDFDVALRDILLDLGRVLAETDQGRPAKTALQWHLAAAGVQDADDAEEILAELRSIGDQSNGSADPIAEPQLEHVLDLRTRALVGDDIRAAIAGWPDLCVRKVVADIGADAGIPAAEALLSRLDRIVDLGVGPDRIRSLLRDREELIAELAAEIRHALAEREQELKQELMCALERFLVVRIIDEVWPRQPGAGWEAEVAEEFMTYLFNIEVVDESDTPARDWAG